MGTLKDRIREIEKNEITAALIDCNWIMAQAARNLGITERMIGYKIKKYGIRKEASFMDNQKQMAERMSGQLK